MGIDFDVVTVLAHLDGPSRRSGLAREPPAKISFAGKPALT
jgi:hypothetical protein